MLTRPDKTPALHASATLNDQTLLTSASRRVVDTATSKCNIIIRRHARYWLFLCADRCDPRIKSLVVSFSRRREVKYIRLPLSGKSENVNLKSYKHDLAVWFRV